MQNENTELSILVEPIISEINLIPAKLDFNFDKLNEFITKGLEPYKIEVNGHNLAESKRTYKELGKLQKKLALYFKEKINIVSENIVVFKESVKQTDIILEVGINLIRDQTKKYDDETRERCKTLLNLELDELCTKLSITDEYKAKVDIDDLAIMSNLGEQGFLTKKAKELVEARVNKALLIENKVKDRLSSLKNMCSTAGLIAPIEREAIVNILEAEDDIYDNCIQSMLQKELTKQNTIIKEVENKPAVDTVKPTSPTPIIAKDGKTTYIITAMFKVVTNIDEDRVTIDFENKIKENFLNSFQGIKVDKI